jgi:hypothetical protein
MAQTVSSRASVADNASSTAVGLPRPFLEGLRLDYGPVPEIAHFLLRADAEVQRRGVVLRFAPVSEIAEINSQQQTSWGAFTPILDVRLAPLNDDNSFCLLGTSLSEQIVTVQGARLFSTGDASLAELARTQALYYGDQGFPGGAAPHCKLTAASASTAALFWRPLGAPGLARAEAFSSASSNRTRLCSRPVEHRLHVHIC